jgi:hypothetical protein
MRKIYIALGLTLLCFSASPLYANHLLGFEITYKYVSGDSFRLEETEYYSCNSIGIYSIDMTVTPKGGSAFTVKMETWREVTTDVTPVCSGASCTLCSSNSCSIPFGIKKTVYPAGVNLKNYNACQFIISGEACCRDNSTTTGGGNSYVYSECLLEKCKAGPHSSPRFARDPVLLWCKNQCATIAQYATGEDGDSLAYSMVMPQGEKGGAIYYNTGYSYYQPFKFENSPDTAWDPYLCQGIRYDSRTGEFSFKPTQTDITTLAFKVRQFKKDSTGKYQEVGYITRNNTLYITNCPDTRTDGITRNSPPAVSGINGTKATSVTACQGKDFAFYIALTDKDYDNIKFSWDKSIPGASFTYSSGKAVFSWKPQKTNVRPEPYYVTVTATDDWCPFPVPVIRRYAIYVKERFPAFTYSRIDSGCGKFYFTALPKDTSKKFFYEWRIKGGLVSKASGFSKVFSEDGTYVIQANLSAAGECGETFTDTVKITGLPPFDAGKDTTVCVGTTVNLKATGGINYKWKSKATLSSDTSSTPTSSPTETTTYYLEGKTKDGCQRYDSVTISVVNVKDPILSKDTLVCQKLTAANPVILKATVLDGAEYTWAPTTGISGSTIASTIKVKPAVTTMYYLSLKTAEGCVFQDSVQVKVGWNKADAGIDKMICEGKTVTLEASGGVAYQWKNDSTLSSLNTAKTEASPTSSRYYYVMVADPYGCTSSDSVFVKVIPFAPSVNKKIAPVCPGDTVQMTATGGTYYTWSPSNAITNVNSPTPRVYPSSSKWYYVTITTNSGCSYRDSVFVPIDTSCVWPGDANHDHKADYLDVLALGIGYKATGPTRNNASNTWKGVTADDWNKKTAKGFDYKHMDCNGDGVINGKDTTAIALNYNRFYGKPPVRKQGGTLTDPVLRWVFDKQTYHPGDTVHANLKLGSSSVPINDCYGIGWKYAYDDKWMVPGSVRFAYACDLFCNAPDELHFHRVDGTGGEVTLVRTQHKGFSGNGTLATLSYILLDSSHAHYSSTGEVTWIVLTYAEPVDSLGNILPLQTQTGFTTIMPLPPVSGIGERKEIEKEIRVYPNPANQTLLVETGSLHAQEIVLFNAIGKEVYSDAWHKAKVAEIPVSGLASGLYFITIKTQEGVISRKIIVQH